jgi:glyoxylase-like metal-dependent hydrolase (beta-lactamase superfamily II)
MILELVVSQYFATNCWIFAPSSGSECFIVDPGVTIPTMVDSISAVLERHNLKPIATLLTHGHIDHTFSANAFDKRYQVQTFIHPKDRPFLVDPMAIVSTGTVTMPIFSQLQSDPFEEPTEVIDVNDGETISLAGFSIKALHAPGHTPGSTIFIVNNEFVISGDVLFNNSIGRTDLPLGSTLLMRKTLNKVILALNDDLIVLPGHGKETTIGKERKHNEYLQERFLKGK